MLPLPFRQTEGYYNEVNETQNKVQKDNEWQQELRIVLLL